MTATILAKSTGGIARLTLNRPKQRNALTPEMLVLLGEKLKEADADPQTRCIILDGAGDHFVAGGDITAWSDALAMPPRERGNEFKARFGTIVPLIDTLDSLQNPLVVAVKGYAVGGGLCFLLAADFVIAEESASFIFANIRAGINPDMALTYYLPRIVGSRMAYRLSLLGSQIDVHEAEKLGIVTDVVPAGQLEAGIDAITRKIMAAPQRAVSEIKKLMRASRHNSLPQQIWAEADSMSACVQEDDFVEAVNAFLERRQPSFGRSQ